MKIAYVTLHWPRTDNSGVGVKIQQQIEVWQKAGHNVIFYMHLHSVKNPDNLISANYYYYRSTKTTLSIPYREISRSLALQRLIKDIGIEKPDLIYLRWGMYAIPLDRMFRKIPVVTEINTNDVFQHQLLGHVLSTYNLLTRSIALSKANGLIFPTHELSNDKAFSNFTQRRVIISNGINLNAYPILSSPNTKIPHLAFIGSPNLPWQGVEKLIELAKILKDIHIDIIGSDMPHDYSIPLNITFHGYLEKERYQKILATATASIGTISLHKKGMQEAAPLKVRECAAFGIPLILPYHDTDLHNLNCSEILEIPNSEDNIRRSVVNIHNFLYSMQGKRLDRKKIWRLLDIHCKERARLEFFNHLLTDKFE